MSAMMRWEVSNDEKETLQALQSRVRSGESPETRSLEHEGRRPKGWTPNRAPLSPDPVMFSGRIRLLYASMSVDSCADGFQPVLDHILAAAAGAPHTAAQPTARTIQRP